MIRIEHEYWEHSSGSKFYEMVHFVDIDTRNAILVKRWGAIGAANGGGQILIERFSTEREGVNEISKISRSKKKASSSGRYEDATPPAGLFFGPGKTPLVIEAKDLRSTIAGHYNAKDTEKVMDYFGLGGIIDLKDEAGLDVVVEGYDENDEAIHANRVRKAEEKEVAERTANHQDWASW